jgi:hypothetical protein
MRLCVTVSATEQQEQRAGRQSLAAYLDSQILENLEALAFRSVSLAVGEDTARSRRDALGCSSGFRKAAYVVGSKAD